MKEKRMEIPADPNAPKIARDGLSDLNSCLGVRYEDIRLVVSELVSNVVKHAHSDRVELVVKANREKVVLEVSDQGPGFLVSDPVDDGLGLAIVERVSSRWGIDRSADRFTVWAIVPVTG